jgi:hypothetical protein
MQPTIPPNDGRVTSHVGSTPNAGPFHIDFPFTSLGEIIVQTQADGSATWSTLVYGSQYTVLGTANEDGSYTNGDVYLTFNISNSTVARFRNTFIERLSNFPLTGYFDRLSLNAEMNRYVMCLQDFQRRLFDFGGDSGGGGTSPDSPLTLRALQTPLGEAPVTVTAGLIAVRANKLLAWNAGGNLTQSNVTLAQMEAVVGAGVPDLTPYAPKDSPLFTGDPRAPTVVTTDNDQSIATTAFVKAVQALGPLGAAGGDLVGTYPNPVLAPIIVPGTMGGSGLRITVQFDAKGRVTAAAQFAMTPGEIGAAPNDSPTLTGNPTAPNPSAPHANDQTLATTKFVTDAVASVIGGAVPSGPAGGDLVGSNYPNPLIKTDVGLAGAPTTTTAAAGDNSTKIATTKFVKDQAYAPLADPVFTGNPTAPTPATADNDTSIATTAMVQAAIAAALSTAAFFTGELKDLAGNVAAPTGWVLAIQGTIGNAASGGTIRAHADCANLFAHLWTLTNTIAPVLPGGRGASAAADFAANKTIGGLDFRGMTRISADNLGGTASNRAPGYTIGVAAGESAHPLTIAELAQHLHRADNGNLAMPAHSHGITRGANATGGTITPRGTYGDGTNASVSGTTENLAATSITGQTDTTGSGTAHNNMQPTRAVTTIMKL